MAEASFLVELGKTFGAPGMTIGVMIWAIQVLRADRRVEHAERLDHDKERLAADKTMAGALAALTVFIQQLGK